jgi:hypothetical protein
MVIVFRLVCAHEHGYEWLATLVCGHTRKYGIWLEWLYCHDCHRINRVNFQRLIRYERQLNVAWLQEQGAMPSGIPDNLD